MKPAGKGQEISEKKYGIGGDYMKKEIYDAFESIKPEEDAKERMLTNIQSMASEEFTRRKGLMKKQYQNVFCVLRQLLQQS